MVTGPREELRLESLEKSGFTILQNIQNVLGAHKSH